MELKRRSSMLAVRLFLLLIVPYGIETRQKQRLMELYLTFNRTLWN